MLSSWFFSDLSILLTFSTGTATREGKSFAGQPGQPGAHSFYNAVQLLAAYNYTFLGFGFSTFCAGKIK